MPSDLPLAERHCVPCRPGADALLPDEIAARLPLVPGWTQAEPGRLHRTYRFCDFAGGLALLNRIGVVADEEDHHPDVLLAWGRLEFTLWTHAANGLTDNDFILAAKIDLLAANAPGRRGD